VAGGGGQGRQAVGRDGTGTGPGPDSGPGSGLDPREVAAALTGNGVAEVDASLRRRVEYSSDASLYRVLPAVVAFPRDPDEVEAALAACRSLQVPLTARGAGTSIAGNAVGPGVVLDFSRHLNRVRALDPEARTATVDPGTVLDDLQRAAAPHGLRFGPDPSTHNRCTLGGMIGNNACGSRALGYGRTADNVHTLDLLAGNGERLVAGRGRTAGPGLPPGTSPSPGTSLPPGTSPSPRTGLSPGTSLPPGTSPSPGTSLPAGTGLPPGSGSGPGSPTLRALEDVVRARLGVIRTELGRFTRQVSGYCLEHLLPERGFDVAAALVGTEGTCGVLLRATVRLVEVPARTLLLVLGYPDLVRAADAVGAVLPHRPRAVEGLDSRIVDVVRTRRGPRAVPPLPRGDGWLFVELAGDTPGELADRARRIVADAGALDARTFTDPAQTAVLWQIRENGAGLAARADPRRPAHAGWEDAAVPPDRLGPYLREFDALLAGHGLAGVPYGHFGDGCVHVRIDFPLGRPGGTAVFTEFLTDAARLVARHGGSVSGEHGDGRARSALLPLMYPPAALAAFAEVKRVFDPDGLLNPGVGVDPAPVDADLRAPSAPALRSGLGLAYPQDAGDLSAAVHRCTGVGACRDTHSSTALMCPSYRATGDEKDSTRGRSRVLQELARGTLPGGWRSPALRESLDLCLACKGCLTDCPTGVDLAAYKAEWLYQAYRHRLRPPAHYLLGDLPRWVRLAARAPRLANAVLGAPLLGPAGRRLAGVDPRRELPRLAPLTFRRWFATHSGTNLSSTSLSSTNLSSTSLSSTNLSSTNLSSTNHTGTNHTGTNHTGTSGSPSPGQAAPGQAAPGLPPPGAPAPEVIVWVDCFTEHFSPQVGVAAVQVLQDAGFAVSLSPPGLCCGLTWISTGRLDTARRVLSRTVRTLAGTATAGSDRPDAVPVVGLEPSCTAVLRGDAETLLGGTPSAGAARAVAGRVRTLAEVLVDRPGWQPPDRSGTTVVAQPHCHHHAALGWQADRELLARTGAEVEVVGGCCGMAGNFGLERGHYDVSLAVARTGLLPALDAHPGAVVLADGFSCRTQLDHLAHRRGTHLAQLLAPGSGSH
jgi:FAD/FMN-containing dehydrogenase/Fe-S oxidoreductase